MEPEIFDFVDQIGPKKIDFGGLKMKPKWTKKAVFRNGRHHFGTILELKMEAKMSSFWTSFWTQIEAQIGPKYGPKCGHI